MSNKNPLSEWWDALELKEIFFHNIDGCIDRANLCLTNTKFEDLCRGRWHKHKCFMNEKRGILAGHTDIVHSVAWRPVGGRLATASRDKTARVWDVRLG